ncbi:MAG: ATP phosphoribosyltransferase regulatory subunit [Candidatus Sungbacteria bacterium]|nr:ATP phosphoribosyltransferase regulatory subunit [Candidatus Sungbacteria bacterium]
MPRPKSSISDFFSRFDRLPSQESLLGILRDKFREIAAFYGFEKIHTSFLEEPRAFLPLAKAGFFDERTPVLCKTRAGAEFALRFSGALSILRAYVVHKMNDLPHPLKFFFDAEGFFLDSPRGKEVRMRGEWGLVMIGEEGPIAEAEVIQVIWKGLVDAGLKGDSVEIRINAVGCAECRPIYRSQLGTHLRNRAARLCRNCKRHTKRSPARIWFCGEEKCKIVGNNAPQVLDFLCDACKKHLRGVLEFLDELRVPYFLDSRLFKDGSFFSTLIFELAVRQSTAGATGEETSAVIFGEGGRMSRAGELIAGKRIDAAAAILQLDKVAACIGGGVSRPEEERPKVFLAQLGELAKRKSFGLLELLRQNDISVRESLGRDSVKSQLKSAELLGAEVALILGQKEALDGTIIFREVQSGIQETIAQEKLIEFLRKKLKK